MKSIGYLKYLIFFFCFMAMPVYADLDPSLQFSQQLTRFRTYAANFTQLTYDQKGRVLQRGQGKVMIMRPGFFRWETNTPTHQVLISDNKTLWIYDQDLSQATRQPLNQATNVNPASLLSGSVKDLNQQFTVSVKSSETGQEFTLTPKQDSINFKWIQMSFEGNLLVSMKVLNNLDETSEFHFTQIQVNGNLSPTLFQFKPPAGVDVVNP